MRIFLLLLLASIEVFGQCGKLVLNPTTGKFDCAGTGAGTNPTNGTEGQGLTSDGSGGYGTPVTLAPSATTDTTNAGNITSGTLGHARLPALVSGDIPNNAANTSGTAANLSGTPAVPNGTSATTQSAGDNSTKIATTGYVDSGLSSRLAGGVLCTVSISSNAATWPNASNGGAGGSPCGGYSITLNQNVTSSNSITGLPNGFQTIAIYVIQDATGGRSLTYPANITGTPVWGNNAGTYLSYVVAWNGTALVGPGTTGDGLTPLKGAPASNPPAGYGNVRFDNASDAPHGTNASGTEFVMPQVTSSVANQFVNGQNADGSLSRTQPSFTNLSGSVAAGQMPAMTGDATSSAGSVALTLASVNAGSGSCGDATHVCAVTTNAKGLVTSQSAVAISGTGGANPGASIFNIGLQTAVTSTSETSLLGVAQTVPSGNFLTTTPLDMRFGGVYSVTALYGSTAQLRLFVDGSAVASTGALTVPAVAVTNGAWAANCVLNTVTTGVSGTATLGCPFLLLPSGTATITVNGGSLSAGAGTFTFNTNTSHTFDLKWTWGGSTGSPTIVAQYGFGQVGGAPVASVNGAIGAVTITPSAGNGVSVSGAGTTSPVYSASSPSRTVSGTSDSLTSSDCGQEVIYTSGSSVAVTIPQAGTSGMSNGCDIILTVSGGVVTVTPTTSTMDFGSYTFTSYAFANGDTPKLHSDGTNYQVLGLSAVYLTSFAGGSTLGASATSYTVPQVNSFNAVENTRQVVFPYPVVLYNLHGVLATSQPGTGSLVCTARTASAWNVTGSNSSMAITWAASSAAGSVQADTTHAVQVSAGQAVSVGCVNNASGTSGGIEMIDWTVVK